MTTDQFLEAITDHVSLIEGDCREVLAVLAKRIERGEYPAFDACITDPPYEIAMMGKNWDATGIAFDPDLWTSVLRCLKPGGHIAAFSLPKQTDRLGVALRKAGASLGQRAEIRDRLLYAISADARWQGFLKSLSLPSLKHSWQPSRRWMAKSMPGFSDRVFRKASMFARRSTPPLM